MDFWQSMHILKGSADFKRPALAHLEDQIWGPTPSQGQYRVPEAVSCLLNFGIIIQACLLKSSKCISRQHLCKLVGIISCARSRMIGWAETNARPRKDLYYSRRSKSMAVPVPGLCSVARWWLAHTWPMKRIRHNSQNSKSGSQNASFCACRAFELTWNHA